MPSVVFAGDSMTGGYTNGGSYTSFFGVFMAARLGWTIAGVNAGVVGVSDYESSPGAIDTIPAIAALAPDAVVMEFGVNDHNADDVLWAATVATCYAALRAALPNAAIYAVAVHWLPGTRYALLAAGVSAVGGAMLNWDPWITGHGYAGAVTGAGNSDVYIGTDGYHPSPAGYSYLGTRLAFALRPPSTGIDY